jgi:hypothetical protein
VDEFELMRRRLRARGAARGEGQQRELTRQFAALGGLPSGAAFKIRQQAQEAAERATSEALQDVNILQAQTQRAEREAEAERGLRRELGQLGARTQIEVAGLGAASAREIAEIQGQFGIQSQQLAIEAARENLATQIAGQRDLAQLDARTKTYLGQLDFDARMRELQVSDETARFMGQLGLQNQLAIASLDANLKNRGLDIQQALADSNVAAQDSENQMNRYATWVNSIQPLRDAGYEDFQIQEIRRMIGIDLDIPEILEYEQQNFFGERAAPIIGQAPITGAREVSFAPTVGTEPVPR